MASALSRKVMDWKIAGWSEDKKAQMLPLGIRV